MFNDKIRCLLTPSLYERQGLLPIYSCCLSTFGRFLPAGRKAAGCLPGKKLSMQEMLGQIRGVFTGIVALIICTLTIFCIVSTAFSEENTPSPTTAPTSTEAVEKTEKTDPTMWQKIWGEKSKDALLLGMWSLHLKGSGEYFGGSGESNEQNKLLGIIYNGVGAGTFINSHDDRSWLIALGRDVYSRQLAENTRLDIGYRLGPLYGYGDSLPNIGKVSLFGAGTIGFSWHKIGFDIMIIPIGVITGGFRVNF